MSIKRFQNRVSESRYALPFMTAITAVIWMLAGKSTLEDCWPFTILMVSTYLMVELNNTNALLNMYSRMVSCSFLALSSTAVFLFSSYTTAITILCVILFCTVLFHTYQDREAPGLTFYAFLFLGIASLVFIQVVFFVPFIWFMMAFYLMALSLRMVWASLLGLIAPYWFGLAVAFITGKTQYFVTHLLGIASFQPLFHYEEVTVNEFLVFGFFVVLSLTGIIHYLRKKRLDRIRTRMIYYFFIAMNLLSMVFIILQPQHRQPLLGMLIVFTSPLIAHFISHGHTRLTNIAFYLMIAAAVLITAFNLWMPSFIF